MTIEKIVSGGQTGVDRAALDVALALKMPCGGWCPRGRIAEDGQIDERYPLVETPRKNYAQRTAWNVRDSDATLIVTVGQPNGGTALTKSVADEMSRPCLVIDLNANADVDTVVEWIDSRGVGVLNIAGPRASSQQEIYGRATGFLQDIFERVGAGQT